MIKMLSLAHISLIRDHQILVVLMMNLIICNMIHAVPLCDYLLTIEPYSLLYVI